RCAIRVSVACWWNKRSGSSVITISPNYGEYAATRHMTGRLDDWGNRIVEVQSDNPSLGPPFQDTLCLCRTSRRLLRIKTDAGVGRHSSTNKKRSSWKEETWRPKNFLI